MKTSDVKQFFGGVGVAAQRMTINGWPISSEAISQWGEFPPLGRQYQIQEITKGKLKVTRQEDRAA